jgi:hypothetical protein
MAIIVRYGISYCTVCNLARPYCPGHSSSTEQPSKDNDDQRLQQRINEVVAKRVAQGGR